VGEDYCATLSSRDVSLDRLQSGCFHPARGSGDLIVGVVGALLGGFLFSLLGNQRGGGYLGAR
jgi:uncharacterized membrane protein YeaQ/YmgE (transglycosylase-associated protein family)